MDVFGKSQKSDEFSYIEETVIHILEQEKQLISRIEAQKPELRDNCLIKLILGGEGIEQSHLMKSLQVLDVTFPFKYTCCAVIKYLRAGNKEMSSNFPDQDIAVCTLDYLEDIVLLLNYSDKDKLNTYICDLEEELKKIGRYSLVGVGSTYNRVEDISKSYQEAKTATEHRLVDSEMFIIWYDEIQNSNNYYYYPMDTEYKIGNTLKAGDYKSAMEIFNDVLQMNMKQRNTSMKTIKYLFFNLVLTVMRVAEETGFKDSIRMDPKDIITIEEIDEMKIYVQDGFFHICDIINKEKESNNTQLIEDIVDYIDNNYIDPSISLTYMADRFKVSSSYLSRYFKDQLGSNFLDYLNRKRIQWAKHLLKETDMDIKTIAKKVGYDSDISFRRIFKKYENITPSEYKDV